MSQSRKTDSWSSTSLFVFEIMPMVDPLLDNLHHHKTKTVSGIRYIGSPSEAHRKGVNAKKTAGSEHDMGQKWKLSLLPCSMASCLPVNITLKETFFRGSLGVYLHKDSTSRKAEHYLRFVQQRVPGMFDAIKWEVRTRREFAVQSPTCH